MRKKTIVLMLGVLLMAFQVSGLLIAQSHSAPFAVVPDVGVWASRMGGGAYGYDSTNSSGQYSITDGITMPGEYLVEATAQGYINTEMNTSIASVNDTATVDFTLNRSAIIVGRVINNGGYGVVGARVELRKSGSFFYDSTTTDSDGKYYFVTNIETGSYYVNVSFSFLFETAAWTIVYGGNYSGLPTYSYMDAPYLDFGYVEGSSGLIAATAGAVSSVPDVVLDGSGIITGYVKDNLNNPMPYAAIRYESLETFDTKVVLTDSSGMYRISYGVVEGSYEVQPHSWGYIAGTETVNATQSGTVLQNFTMVKSASVSGHVLRSVDSKPLPEVQVQLMSEDFSYIQFAATDVNGYYAIGNGLGPGNYTAQAMLSGTVLNMTTFSLTIGETKTVDFTGDAYFISGTVYENVTQSSERVPYPDVDLDFVMPGIPGGSTSGDIDGMYEMVVPIELGTLGLELEADFTVDASQYNQTVVTYSVTIGADAAFDFALYPSPPSPPSPPSATIRGTIYGNAGPDLPFTHQVWHLTSLNYTFMVEVNTTSSISYVWGNLDGSGYVYVSVWGLGGTNGTLTIWIPLDIYFGPFSVDVFPGSFNVITNAQYNLTHQIIIVEYSHSYDYVYISSEHWVPEFATPIMVIVALSATSAIALFEKKRRTPKLN